MGKMPEAQNFLIPPRICFDYVENQTLQQRLPMVGFNITFLQLIANVMVRFKRCLDAAKATYNQILTLW